MLDSDEKDLFPHYMFLWLSDFPTLFILTLPEIEIAYQNTTLRLKPKKPTLLQRIRRLHKSSKSTNSLKYIKNLNPKENNHPF